MESFQPLHDNGAGVGNGLDPILSLLRHQLAVTRHGPSNETLRLTSIITSRDALSERRGPLRVGLRADRGRGGAPPSTRPWKGGLPADPGRDGAPPPRKPKRVGLRAHPGRGGAPAPP